MGLAAGSAAMGLAGRLGATDLAWPFAARDAEGGAEITVLDCGKACTISESLAGYESALRACGVPHRRVFDATGLTAKKLIVPAAHLSDCRALQRIKKSLARGGMLLFESGATFLEAREFEIHQRLMESEFGIRLGAPWQLWEGGNSARQTPYINYEWPAAAKIRDFSRLIPVDCEGVESIASFEDLTLAVKRPAGRGTMVFLGSPLGPHLLAGDREAESWFKQFCSSC